ncbi:MAG TPA: class I SAM-dependent methyltransferase [Actinomycetota bacterium]|nr:class I SAM-dependent methyltransferase [Actinomycetota bacterium]
MAERMFDEHAQEYDAWFLKNQSILTSEVLLLERLLRTPGKALSVGCGSGLFEQLLRTRHGLEVRYGVEPAEGMARIAERRGLTVRRGTAENLPFEDEEFDTVILNGIPSYIEDLERAFREAHRVLEPGGHVVVADVPAENSYGLLYRLAAAVGTWDDPFLRKAAPRHPYPVEFAAAANWRTTGEKAELLRAAGFVDLEYAQTLTRHPKFSNDEVEEPVEGFDRGDYVAIRGRKA